MKEFGSYDIAQIAFVGELVENRCRGATTREGEIDAIGKVGDDTNAVEHQEDDAHNAVIACILLEVEGQQHQEQIERIEVEQGRGVEQQRA